MRGSIASWQFANIGGIDVDLEKHFLVVYWDQRGAGRSIDADIVPQSMTIARFKRALDQVIALVNQGLHKRKVVLLAHSSGACWAHRRSACLNPAHAT